MKNPPPLGWWPSSLDRSSREWGLALEALALLGAARLAILLLPFRILKPHLGGAEEETGAGLEGLDAETDAIAWAVDSVARRTPWDSTCLARCLAARVMLHRRGIPSTLTLGVGPTERGPLSAHAWLSMGGRMVIGGDEAAPYTPVARFSDQPRRRGARP